MVTSGKLFAPSTTVAGLQLVSELCTSCNSSLSVKRNLRFSTQLLLNSRKFYEKPAGVRRGLSGYQELESRKYSQRLGSLEAISVNKHSLLESVQPTTRVRVTIATSAMQEDGFEGRGDDGSWDSEPGSRFAEGTQRKFSSRGNNGQFGQRRPNSSSNGSEFRSSDRSERGRGVEARQFPSKGPGGRSSSLRGRDETRSFGGRGDLARKSEPERRGGEGRSRGRGIAANGKDVQFRRVASNADDENVQDNKVSVDHRRERTKSKHPAVREQVSFVEPMSSDPNIAIIGGGISGIVCALTLAERGIRSTLFDTGKHGLGGRMATRHVEYRGDAVMTFDHAAQFFTVSDPRFQRLVDRWQEDGLVKEWKGVIGTIQAGGSFVELPLERRYVGIGGMRALCDRLAEQSPLITVKRPVWISHLHPMSHQWGLRENSQREGDFDAVVIAHNGKCANRLLAPSGVPSVARQMKRLELSAVWALMAAFNEPLPLPRGLDLSQVSSIAGAFVEGVDAVSWMGNNSAKQNGEQSSLQCWTFFSSAHYGRKNKVPQEAIPTVRAQKVTQDMLAGVELALGLTPGQLPTPVFQRVQLWGAALPLNAPGVECIFDAAGRVGICGDWLLAPCVEGAALSGMALGHRISDFRDSGGESAEFSIGLDTQFQPAVAHDIGAFPSSSATPKEDVKLPVLAKAS